MPLRHSPRLVPPMRKETEEFPVEIFDSWNPTVFAKELLVTTVVSQIHDRKLKYLSPSLTLVLRIEHFSYLQLWGVTLIPCYIANT